MKAIVQKEQIYRTKRGRALLGHTVNTSIKYKLWMAFLLIIICIGGYAYYKQLKLGLAVTADSISPDLKTKILSPSLIRTS